MDASGQLYCGESQRQLASWAAGPVVAGYADPAVASVARPQSASSQRRPVVEFRSGRAGVGDHEIEVPAGPADRLTGIEDDEVVPGLPLR